MSIIVITLYVSTRGMDYLPTRVARFALTGALCLWLYRGSNAARGISIVLFGFAGVQAAMTLFQGGELVVLAFLSSMAISYLSFTVVLIASPSVSAFLEYQRKTLQPKRIIAIPIGDIFQWPKDTVLKPLDRLTIVLPTGILGADEELSAVINCDRDAEITMPQGDDKIYLRLNVGMQVWLRRSSQAIVLPWDDGESDPKRIEISPFAEGSV